MANTNLIWRFLLIFELEFWLFRTGDECARQFGPGFPEFLYHYELGICLWQWSETHLLVPLPLRLPLYVK
jgi:hypothetical protein